MDDSTKEELARKGRKIYMREYRKRNRERLAQYNREWFAKQAIETRSLTIDELEAELEQLKQRA